MRAQRTPRTQRNRQIIEPYRYKINLPGVLEQHQAKSRHQRGDEDGIGEGVQPRR